MATFNIPRLVGKTNANGLTRWYWQPSKSLRAKGWEPVPLGQSMGEVAPPEIVAGARALNDKVEGGADAIVVARQRLRPPTIAEAIARYRTAGYPSIKHPGQPVSAGTRREYDQKFKALIAWGGDVAVTSITPERVAKLRDALMMPAKTGPRAGEVRHHTAHATLRVGRSLFAWFERERIIGRGTNPFTDFALATPAPRDAIWWQPHRDALTAAAIAEGDEAMALAIELAFLVGQREADLLKLQIRQYDVIPSFKMDPEVWEQLAEPDADGVRCVKGISLRQGKTKRWVEVPVVGDARVRLEQQIEAAKAASSTMLLLDQRSNRPWTLPNLKAGQTRFIRRFAEIRAAAIATAAEAGDVELAGEIEQLQYRDFRRTAVVYLGELALPDHLIAAITGHDLDETKQILETYMPRTTGMAARAIALSHARAAPAANQEKKA